ncbi:MAG: glutamate-5-semialdehyde dehydrogenase [Eubacteriales bacterium]|nr:glutamate-5-semialdehyde dehydrogenase [Eubacteriales bacterium]
MSIVLDTCRRAAAVKHTVGALSTTEKNRVLQAIADALDAQRDTIREANAKDIAAGRENGLNEGLIDRLTLDDGRIDGIVAGCRAVAALPDPVGEVSEMKVTPNGLKIGKKRVPMGVIGIIYESRPNVTVDAAALCFKAGSACVLRGGKEAYRSNRCLMDIMRGAVESCGLPADALNLIDDLTHEGAGELMRANGLIDILIPRGGAGLIRTVVNNATVPVIETGTGNCHIYVDASADLTMALDILNNAKCQRVSVCNAAESLLVHRDVAEQFLPMAQRKLDESHVLLHGCPRTREILPDIAAATEEDYGKEYLDYEMSVKVVDSLDEAIEHINRYNTGHSEAIVTHDYFAAQKFLDRVDAAAVYVNASTRFTDGGEFGFGAEIGISTQKLHARGPMGLRELTTNKYIIYGEGQIR